MSGTYPVVLGDRGRLVIPAELRERMHLTAGTPLALVETPRGFLVMTRQELKRLVREDLAGADLVEELLNERRAAAVAEDAG
jgi:AbrB family looped-hinge helix DNA binding protein